MKKFNLFFALGLFLMFGFFQVSAQISQGGSPMSFSMSNLKEHIDVRSFDAPNMEQIIMEDMENDGFGKAYRIGILVPIHLNPENSGTWDELPNGDFLWRVRIDIGSPEASSLFYDNFYLPPGAKLFVYNPTQSFVIGAFTEFNNHESGVMSTQMIPGGSSVVELYLPKEQRHNYDLEITEVAYNYRSTGFNENANKDLSCMVNVNCPAGNNYANEIRSVARVEIRIGSGNFLCTGALVNTTTNSCQPFFLLADHCAYYNSYATATNLNQWKFYFNYQSSTCTGSTGPLTQSVTGCALRAHDTYGQNGQGSDFYLVLINNNIPNTYSPYYSGWSRATTAATSGASIHHPDGTIKKISLYNTTLSNFTTHWRVYWSTISGSTRSVTAPGSSGSPIYNQNKLIVGTLTGGMSACSVGALGPGTGPNEPDYYGKFSYHWMSNGSTAAKQLQPWLDQNSTNPITKTGVNFNNCSAASINELPAPNLSLNIYPNPASEMINIRFENYYFDNGTIRIFDILGNVVATYTVETYQAEIAIPISHLSEGLYYVNANNSNHSFSKGFIIAK